jgi:hypothetical protein
MTWSKLDDGFLSNPKILALGIPARWVYVSSIVYANAHLTDGFVPDAAFPSLALGADDPDGILSELTRILPRTEHSLWEPVEGGWMIHDFLDYNPSRKAVEAKREAVTEERSKAGRIGAQRRWQTDGKPMANAKQNDGPVPGPVPVPVIECMDEGASDFPLQPEDDDPAGTLPISEQRKILALLDVGINHGMGAEFAQKCSLKRIQDVIAHCRAQPGLTSPTGRIVNMLRSGEAIPKPPLPANKSPGKGKREAHYDEAQLEAQRKADAAKPWAAADGML